MVVPELNSGGASSSAAPGWQEAERAVGTIERAQAGELGERLRYCLQMVARQLQLLQLGALAELGAQLLQAVVPRVQLHERCAPSDPRRFEVVGP